MEASERDSTQDWEIPRGHGPLLIAEIEEKVDAAITIARASEQGVKEIGEAALDAARQARRAAEMAAAASLSAAEARDAVGGVRLPDGDAAAAKQSSPAGVDVSSAAGAAIPSPPLTGEARLRRFSERCDRVSARLRALERRPGAPAVPSGSEARRRGAG
jgi:hypothetical protein